MAATFDLSAMQLVAQHRREAVDRCVEALAHSCVCADAYCRLPACPKMKRVVIHTNICQRKNKGSCPVCKQLIALCCYHAKNCKDMRCVVPFCNMVKQKMRRQQKDPVYERLRAARGLEPDEPDEIDVNIIGGVSGWTWRMVRIVPSPSQMEKSDDGEQAPEAEHEVDVPDAEENDSGDSNLVTDNNNVGENDDTTDTSSDEGPNEPANTSNSDETPANETEEQSESTKSE